ncbi:MAG: YybS family protein [Hyphomicrobiaceae bacterium]|nr:YybS family protein [Hyphomicrobiaceae bacterium]
MTLNLPVGLLAGVSAAVLFLLAATGGLPLSIIMLALVPVPIALAGLSYNAATALAAAVIGFVGVASLFKAFAVALYSMAAIPIAGLVYLALLRREDTGSVEWYPIGRVVLAAAIASGGLFAFSILPLASEPETYRKAIDSAVSEVVKQGLAGLPDEAAPTAEQLRRLGDVLAVVVPAAGGATVLLSLLASLYLGGRVARSARTLVRPWPDLAAMRLPAGAPMLLAASLLGAMWLTGPSQAIALSFAGAFYMAYTLLGLAVVHYVTRGAFWRGAALALLYAVLVFNLGASLLLAMVGLADSLFPLRRGANEAAAPGSPSDTG